MAGKEEKVKLLEDVYEETGGMGAYQWSMFLLLGMCSMFGVESININFVAGSQDHWCHVTQLQNLSHDHQKYIAIPQDSDGDYESCSVYDFPYNQYSLEDFISWNRSLMIQNVSTKSCDKWVYDQSLYVSTITSRFDLVCKDKWMVSFLSTMFMCGVFVGAVSSGFLSDRIGRKTTLCAGLTLKIAATWLATFPTHYTVTVMARFLMAIGSTCCYLTGFVLLMEILTIRWRTALGVVYQIFFSLGFIMWPLLSYFIRDDMKVQLSVAVPVVLLMSFWWLIDESPRWLMQKEKYEMANKVLRKIGESNRCPLQHDFDSRDIDETKTDGEAKSCMALLVSPTLRVQTLVVDLYWFTVSLMYYALSLNTEALSGDVFVNTVISGAVEIPANILAVFFLGWHVTGRKYTCLGSLLIAGMASFISVYMILKDIGIAHTIFAAVAKGFVTLAFSAIYVYSSEIFPTEVRNAGMGTASMCARISGMAASYVGGPLGDIWAPLPPVVYGSFAVVSGLLTIFLPETLGAPMFRTIEEAEKHLKGCKTLLTDRKEKETQKEAPNQDNNAFEHTYF